MSKKTKQQKHLERLAEKEKHHVEHLEAEAHAHDDEFVVAPKGMSRRRFLFTLGITIFVVLAFVVPGAIMSSLGGGSAADREYVSWQRPGQDPVSLSVRDFQTEKQAYNRLVSSITRQSTTLSDEDMAAILLEDELAKGAGIVITDGDLRKFLGDQLGFTLEVLQSVARQNRMTPVQFEDEMRRFLRVRRYRNLLTQGMQFPDPAEVEKQWKDQFREYKFVFVEAKSEDFNDAAAALVPSDEELQTWFNALPEFQRNNFMTPRRMSAEFAIVQIDDAPAALLEAFTLDENVDLDLIHRNYYDLVSPTRFQRPAPEDNGDEDSEPADLTIPYEEVTEACAAEAPIYNALHEWVSTMAPIANDPAQELDFAAAAAEYGATYLSDGVLRSQEEWEAFDTYGSVRLGNMLRFSAKGNLLSSVLVGKGFMMIGRCTAIENPKIPALADMRDDVVEAWVETKRADLALEKLTSVFESFLATPEDAPTLGGVDVEDQAFTDAVTGAGFVATEREWRDRIQPPPGGFADAAPIELFLRQNPVSYILSDGQVSEPALDGQRKHAYMIRMVGSRAPELVAMKPAYVENIGNNLINKTATDFAKGAFGFEAYAAKFNLELHPDEPVAPAPQ